MRLRDRVISGAAWSLAGAAFKNVVRIAIVAATARLILPEHHGVFVQATVAVGLVHLFLQLGLGVALVQRQELDVQHERTALAIAIVAATLGSGLTVLVAPFVVPDDVVEACRALCPALGVRILAGVPRALLEREMRIRTIATVDSLAYVCGNGVVAVAFAAFGFGFWSLAIGHTVASIIEALLFFRLRPTKLFPLRPGRAAKDLLGFGTSFTLVRAANYVALQGDYAVVGSLLGATAVSYYSRAYAIMAVPASVLDALEASVFPAFSQLQRAPEQLRNAYRATLSLVLLVMLPGAVVLWIIAPELVAVVLGPIWVPVTPILRVLAFAVLFRAGYKIPSTLARAVGRLKVLLVFQLIYAVTVVAGTAVGARWGVEGAAIAVTLALGIQFVAMTAWTNHVVQVSSRETLRTLGHSMFCAILIGSAGWLTAQSLRNADAPALLTLSVTALVVGSLSWGLVRFKDGRALGPEGAQLLRRFVKRPS